MKTLTFLLALVLTISTSCKGQTAVQEEVSFDTVKTGTLTIELTGLKSDKGDLMVGLYNSEDTWLGQSFKGEMTKIKDGVATVIFTDVPYGIYAASAIHDKDANGKLNTGAFGIPSEPYASSRGAIGMFGPPKWKDAKFTIDTAESTEKIDF